MTQLTHWNPFRSLAKASPQVDFEDFFRGFGMRPLIEQLQVPDIRLDVSEAGDAFAIKADIPGVKKEDIEVSVDGRQVTISATIAEKSDKRDKAALYSERCEGQAYRSFTLPTEVDSKGAKAHYENGVLELTLPKSPNGNGKRIRVS